MKLGQLMCNLGEDATCFKFNKMIQIKLNPNKTTQSDVFLLTSTIYWLYFVVCCYSSGRLRKEIDIIQKVATNKNEKEKANQMCHLRVQGHNEETQSHGTTLTCGCLK